ncbi:MAG TPA: hypothetical protein VH415_11195 [Nitrososphaeraceae archaeon]
MIKVGKIFMCSACGEEKSIVYGSIDLTTKEVVHYCRQCRDLQYKTVTCDVCGQEAMGEYIAQHKLNAHSD